MNNDNNTKYQIQKQLLEIMKVKNVNTIKVREVTDSLNISRSTFYLHYNSIFAVLQEIEDIYFNELESITCKFCSYPYNPRYLKDPHPIIFKAFSYVKENKEVTKVLWGPYGDCMFQVRCRKMPINTFFPNQVFRQKTFEEEEFDFITTYISSGYLSLVNQWINTDCKCSIEKMSLLSYRLIFNNN